MPHANWIGRIGTTLIINWNIFMHRDKRVLIRANYCRFKVNPSYSSKSKYKYINIRHANENIKINQWLMILSIRRCF